jgi:hypothetical protein
LEPLGFILGVATFGATVTLKKPLRKVAVFTTSQLISIFDKLKATAYELKEEIEDVVAEAQYENMKKYTEAVEAGQESENSQKEE